VVIGSCGKVRNRRGKTRLGCLFSLMIAATVGYYGVDVGDILFKRWQLIEEMKAQAGFATNIDDVAIRRRLVRKIESLGIPNAARSNLRIQRTYRPREIIISTAYEVTFILPFTTRADTLNLEIRSPL
jgi:hypothetical protein